MYIVYLYVSAPRDRAAGLKRSAADSAVFRRAWRVAVWAGSDLLLDTCILDGHYISLPRGRAAELNKSAADSAADLESVAGSSVGR